MGGGTESSRRSQAAHPDAPATESGRAYFRDANAYLDDESATTLRHARSPASRLLLAQANVIPANAGSQVQGASRNPPPATQTLNEVLVRTNTAEVDFEIRVRIRADRTAVANIPAGSARTRISPSGGLRQYQGMGTRVSEGRVVALSRKLVIRGTYTIRTAYGRRASATQISQYGRGTTSQDKANGDITLGFHEWCHQQEYLTYVRTTPFPSFSGRIGMSQEDFLEAADQFNSDYETFRDDLIALGDGVDEVGYTKTRCIADGRCR